MRNPLPLSLFTHLSGDVGGDDRQQELLLVLLLALEPNLREGSFINEADYFILGTNLGFNSQYVNVSRMYSRRQTCPRLDAAARALEGPLARRQRHVLVVQPHEVADGEQEPVRNQLHSNGRI